MKSHIAKNAEQHLTSNTRSYYKVKHEVSVARAKAYWVPSNGQLKIPCTSQSSAGLQLVICRTRSRSLAHGTPRTRAYHACTRAVSHKLTNLFDASLQTWRLPLQVGSVISQSDANRSESNDPVPRAFAQHAVAHACVWTHIDAGSISQVAPSNGQKTTRLFKWSAKWVLPVIHRPTEWVICYISD